MVWAETGCTARAKPAARVVTTNSRRVNSVFGSRLTASSCIAGLPSVEMWKALPPGGCGFAHRAHRVHVVPDALDIHRVLHDVIFFQARADDYPVGVLEKRADFFPVAAAAHQDRARGQTLRLADLFDVRRAAGHAYGNDQRISAVKLGPFDMRGQAEAGKRDRVLLVHVGEDVDIVGAELLALADQ